MDLQHNMDATYTCKSRMSLLTSKVKHDSNKLNFAIFVLQSAIILNGLNTQIGAGQYHKLIHQATKCMRQDECTRLT